MSDVIKSIDWTQVGPFTALLLILAVVALGLAPFAFRYLGKRTDVDALERAEKLKADAEDRKRDYERESRKDEALIRIVDSTQKLGENVNKLSLNVERLTENLNAFESRFNVKIDSVEKNLSTRIDKLFGADRPSRSKSPPP